MGSYRCCLCFRRSFRESEAPPPADVRAAFAEHAGGGLLMSEEHLRGFLAGAGDESADVERIIERICELRKSRAPRLGLALEDFHSFLFNTDLNPPIKTQVHQDMNAPLSWYFIYTGHNSYLTGNQLSSDCSDVPIINALKRGVRVIELDMWPTSDKKDINILHGRTLTSPVSLGKCLTSIKKFAFVASPYPVIITLEDHLTPDLQAKVAKMVVEIFGDILYYPTSETAEEFPSPEALRGRVILSTKPPKEYQDSKIEIEVETDKKKIGDEDVWGSEVADLSNEILSEEKNEPDQLEQPRDVNDTEEGESLKASKAIAPEYRALITIKAGKPKGTLADALKVDPDKVRRLSLSEQQLAKAVANHSADIIRFTQKNLLRIYPRGSRLNSSNYNPYIGWIHGAQMVAFNMQSQDRALWLMHGFFKANGHCGYVKKPEFLMKTGPHGEVFDPKAVLPVKETLKVKVYMGDGWQMDFKKTHFDQFSPPDFYVRVGIAGVPTDSTMVKTRAIEDDWRPVWEEEFAFDLTVPELALLRIEVHEYDMSEKDDFGGQTVLPVSELRPGIRAVPLFDKAGMKLNSVKLLMCFEIIKRN